MANVQTAVFQILPIQPPLPHLDNSISLISKLVNFQEIKNTPKNRSIDIQVCAFLTILINSSLLDTWKVIF